MQECVGNITETSVIKIDPCSEKRKITKEQKKDVDIFYTKKSSDM